MKRELGELAAGEARQQRRRSLQGIAAIALWGAGCYLLYLASSLTQALPSPLGDILRTVVYLLTFFYIFAFWPIQSLVERLFEGHERRRAARVQNP
jgi:hypothetical protein